MPSRLESFTDLGALTGAVLLVFIAGIVGSIAPQPEQQDRQPPEPHRAQSPQIGSPTQTAYHRADSLVRAACEQGPENREQADLCQQWRMAEATEAMKRLTGRQLGVGFGEVLLVLVGVTIAWKAATEAGKAARAAEAGLARADQNLALLTKAIGQTEESLRYAREAAHDDRAWMAIMLYRPKAEAIGRLVVGLRVLIDSKNVGATPALSVHPKMQLKWVPAGEGVPLFKYDLREIQGHGFVVAPGVEHTQGVEDMLPLEQLQQAVRGEIRIFCFTSIYYKDIYQTIQDSFHVVCETTELVIDGTLSDRDVISVERFVPKDHVGFRKTGPQHNST